MKSTLRISLKSGERIFINGAVLRVDRKVALEFLNDVTFLLENHVLQPEEATTPLKQLYFIAQMMLINPEGAQQSMAMFRKSITMLLSCFRDEEVLAELKRIDGMVSTGRAFDALKAIRGLYQIEQKILSNEELSPAAVEQIRKEIAPWSAR
jgi:flagellar biosynthesis repressor protein FlbT